jgi:hypothetical protein
MNDKRRPRESGTQIGRLTVPRGEFRGGLGPFPHGAQLYAIADGVTRGGNWPAADVDLFDTPEAGYVRINKSPPPSKKKPPPGPKPKP